MRVRPCGAALFRAAPAASWIWLLAMAALAGGGLYMLRAQLVDSTSALVFAVTQQYAEAIPGMQAVHLDGCRRRGCNVGFHSDCTLYALLCSWTVMRSESLVYLLVLTLPVLALCLIILQTPPAARSHFARCRCSCAASSDAAAPRTAGRRGEPAGAGFWPRRWRS
ncbi:MAG: hypothetical protein ACLU3I_14765 [Acutalibacteraceae bacterium]